MKKFTTKLLMSIIAVAFAFVALGTSTYAWFSMNTQVQVTGMQVTAKTDNTYLLIGDGENDTYQEIQAINPVDSIIEWVVSDDDSELYPVAPVTTDGELAYFTGSATAAAKVTNAATAAAVANWYTAKAEKPSEATIDAETAEQLTTFNKYVLVKSVWLTVAEGAQPAHNLTVSATFTAKTTGKDITGAKLLIVTSDGGFAILKNGASTNVDIKGANTNITDQTVVKVDMYIYYDGNETAVYTNNAAELSGAQIALSFDVTSAVANN
jgi:hypothetical protein